MQYAVLGKTGLKVSRLGFGCMRLPMKSATEVDRDLAIPMLRRGFELGINYFDTAVGYCAGDSQRVLGEAMEDIRDKVILSTKNHHYDKADKAGWWKNLEDSLERLRVDCIDVYNLHMLNYDRFEEAVDGEDGLYQELLKAKEQGLIEHICHSFHGSNESLVKCIDTGLFESITVQYNLLDRHLEEGIAHAHEKGLGVTIMGPVGGGRLGYPSDKASELVGGVKSTPELALRFVLSNPNVTIALSGMQNLQQLEENVATVSSLGALTEEDHEQIEEAVRERKELLGLYCTGCGYCMPCPEGVDIPANLEILNIERVFGLTDHARAKYAALGGKAAFCRLCGKCLEECPQDLDIPARLAEVVAVLDERAGSVSGWGELRGAERRDDGLLSVGMRYHLKNFTDEAQEVTVEFQPHYEEQVQPNEFEVETLKAYGRRHRDLQVLVTPPLEMLTLDAMISFDGSHTLEHLHYVLTTAERTGDGTPDTSDEPARELHVPSPLHPVLASSKAVKGHSLDFDVCYDDDALYLWADVEDDLVCAAEEEIKGRMKADNICIFLDGRDSRDLGKGGYTDGVMRVTVYPPADEGAEPQVSVSNDSEAKVKLVRTPVGYRAVCAVPWSAFSQVEGVPGVIGFDIAMASYDADSKEVVRMAWTGRERQERDPAMFGRLLLV